MALKPAAINASSSVNVVGSSAVQPMTFPPKTKGEISRLELPSLRFFIAILSPIALTISAHILGEAERGMVHQKSRAVACHYVRLVLPFGAPKGLRDHQCLRD